MIDTSANEREHYSATGLTGRIQSALAALAPEGQMLTVAQLALLDQLHLRGILATSDLASAAGIEPSTRVLDLGRGIGGPARYLAARFGCRVTGVDLGPTALRQPGIWRRAAGGRMGLRSRSATRCIKAII